MTVILRYFTEFGKHAGDHVAAVAGGIQACTENGTVPAQIIRQCKLSATAAMH